MGRQGYLGSIAKAAGSIVENASASSTPEQKPTQPASGAPVTQLLSYCEPQVGRRGEPYPGTRVLQHWVL